jgi:energy-coupling factor transporter ATP-binding protein EcfA2
MQDQGPVISLDNVQFTYRGNERPSLKIADLQVHAGEFILVTGPSGGGKSTLARLLTGLIPQSYPGELTGAVNVFGRNVITSKVHEIAQDVGLVLQNPENQLFALTLEDDIAFGPENLGLPSNEIGEVVSWSLNVTKLESERFRPPFELSGGLQQRAAIAGTLAIKPKILVLDEPTSSMDPLNAHDFAKFLNRMRLELSMTIILIEQRLELFYKLATRTMVMKEGEIVVDAPPVQAFEMCERIGLQLNFPLSFLFWRKYAKTLDQHFAEPIQDPLPYVKTLSEEYKT